MLEVTLKKLMSFFSPFRFCLSFETNSRRELFLFWYYHMQRALCSCRFVDTLRQLTIYKLDSAVQSGKTLVTSAILSPKIHSGLL